MPDLLVRNVDTETVTRLKALAKAHHRSLQAELREILDRASTRPRGDWRKALQELDRMFEGRTFSDSVELIREERERR
jgi:plasmid stability protein